MSDQHFARWVGTLTAQGANRNRYAEPQNRGFEIATGGVDSGNLSRVFYGISESDAHARGRAYSKCYGPDARVGRRPTP